MNEFSPLGYNTPALNNLNINQHPRGVVPQASWLRTRQLQDKLLHLIGSYGYTFLDLPILESTDLLLRKSGGDLASQIYSFLDPAGASVSLRPEFTSSLMQYFLDQPEPRDMPARWQYAGPVFRFGGPGTDTDPQFTQVGAELIGASGVLADAELVTLASEVLLSLGIDDFTVQLADLQVLNSLLEVVRISDRARSFVAANIPAMRSGEESVTSLLDRAMNLHLVGQGAADRNLAPAIAGLDDDQARSVLHGFLSWSGSDLLQLGQRDPDEVVERLLRKLRGSDDPSELERALHLAHALANVRGEPESGVAQARQVLSSSSADPAPLDRLEELVRLLTGQPALRDSIRLDFGLMRGIAYYNGIVFEVAHPSLSASLGGGGRYDSLALAFGNPDPVPALGFACNLNAIMELADDRSPGLDPDVPFLEWPESALIVPSGPAARLPALLVAEEWRRQGSQARLSVLDSPADGSMAGEDHRAVDSIVTVDADGQQTVRPSPIRD